MKRRTLEDLFIDQLRDVYDAEKQLVKALPKMAKAATSAQLGEGFAQHLRETEEQVRRLEQVFEKVGHKLKGKTCEAMEGLIEEGKEIIDMKADPEVRDAGLIAAAQKVEHYEIASYGCLCAWAQQLDWKDVQTLLHESLEEEKRTDAKLTELAESHINAAAIHHGMAEEAHADAEPVGV